MLVKNEEETFDKIKSDDRNNGYITDNLLGFAYFQKNYKTIAIGMSKQTKLKNPKNNKKIGKLENKAHGAKIFFIIEESEETTSKLQFWKYFIKMGTPKIVSFLSSPKLVPTKNGTLLKVNQKVVIPMKIKKKI